MGRRYLAELRREVVRLAMLTDEDMDGNLFSKAAQRLEEDELLELKRVFEVGAAKKFPAAAQLQGRPAAERGDETVFLV